MSTEFPLARGGAIGGPAVETSNHGHRVGRDRSEVGCSSIRPPFFPRRHPAHPASYQEAPPPSRAETARDSATHGPAQHRSRRSACAGRRRGRLRIFRGAGKGRRVQRIAIVGREGRRRTSVVQRQQLGPTRRGQRLLCEEEEHIGGERRRGLSGGATPGWREAGLRTQREEATSQAHKHTHQGPGSRGVGSTKNYAPF